MKVLILADYLGDGFKSMDRYAEILFLGLKNQNLEVKLIRPREFFPELRGKLPRALSKALGYISKYCIFPWELLEAIRWADLVHICDQYNAVYVPLLGNKAHLVSCHDLLSVRAAMGEETYCYPSFSGKILQRLILFGLKSASAIACVSEFTLQDLKRVLGSDTHKKLKVINNCLDPSFLPISGTEAKLLLEGLISLSRPYVLVVGSDLPRKNRTAALQIFSKIKDEFEGELVFAGKALNPEQLRLAEQLGILERVKVVLSPSDRTLSALYSLAHCLLFPSLSEGFGWPIIEAQFFACPVVCSDCPPFAEVGGGFVLSYSLKEPEQFAAAILELKESRFRRELTAGGRLNAERFQFQEMLSSFRNFYEELLRP
ncbi:MAG: glycosyltransferase family 4 protein [Candidatus Obscuribacterales bacterium]|nr:glycosyltransferase family 4 protein [Candidatus Obscuribacterales bacterium]